MESVWYTGSAKYVLIDFFLFSSLLQEKKIKEKSTVLVTFFHTFVSSITILLLY